MGSGAATSPQVPRGRAGCGQARHSRRGGSERGCLQKARLGVVVLGVIHGPGRNVRMSSAGLSFPRRKVGCSYIIRPSVCGVSSYAQPPVLAVPVLGHAGSRAWRPLSASSASRSARAPNPSRARAASTPNQEGCLERCLRCPPPRGAGFAENSLSVFFTRGRACLSVLFGRDVTLQYLAKASWQFSIYL